MIWVNGLAIGRFWEIGPQQTLFMPGCWLKEGENEVIVLDLKGPEKASIRGLKKPILDWLRNEGASTHRKEGEQLDLSRETPKVRLFRATDGRKSALIVRVSVVISALRPFRHKKERR